MLRRMIAGMILPALLVMGCSTESDTASVGTSEPTAAELLDTVVAAMGTADLDAITFSGRAWRIRNGWMQTPQADPPWSYRDEITNYRHTIDFDAPASLAQGDTFASDLFLNPPTAGTYRQSVAVDNIDWSDRLEIWLTPWGFVEGAVDNGVELSSGKLDGVDYRVLSWRSSEDQVSPSGMRYTVNG